MQADSLNSHAALLIHGSFGRARARATVLSGVYLSYTFSALERRARRSLRGGPAGGLLLGLRAVVIYRASYSSTRLRLRGSRR